MFLLEYKIKAKQRQFQAINEAIRTGQFVRNKALRLTIAIPPHYTSQDCPSCERRVKKSLSTRTHACECGYVEDREQRVRAARRLNDDWGSFASRASAIRILQIGLSTQGHWGTYATGDLPSWAVGATLLSNGESLNVEPLDS